MNPTTPIEWARALAEALALALRRNDWPTVNHCAKLVESFKAWDTKGLIETLPHPSHDNPPPPLAPQTAAA